MSYRITFSSKALEDIDKLQDESKYSEDKTLEYLDGLYDKFDLMKFSPLGTDRPEFGKNCRSFFYGSHTVVYTENNKDIEVFGVFRQEQELTKGGIDKYQSIFRKKDMSRDIDR
tara:strand:- start:7728 stop:8069 length:342 start_codon:yes stop_codon:yes gene_type:complete